MKLDSELRQKLQIFLLAAIVLAGGRAAYIVYQRHAARKTDEQPKQVQSLNPDYYVTPKKLYPHDLKSARQLTEQPVWVRTGYYNTYYPYDRARHKTDFAHEAGTLPPLQKLQVEDVVTEAAPQAPGVKQVLARFALDGKSYAVPIGVEKDGEYKIYSDNMFFVEDPHELYKHWPADVWKAIDHHEVQLGMTELEAACAIGLGTPADAGAYGSRTLHYPNGGKPLTITYRNDQAVGITPGS